ncbi:MAG: hypothetical protein FRX48_09483 [Lasallia pustulata]|uniref:DH domain-containing protein n=1 Tax=Lasallia pustulata TaxID=136370 RepID=A0A5M8PCV4_9LECA|nr:MAG: hypothetical protein FRX48_09483 [Lasallia pustulata]
MVVISTAPPALSPDLLTLYYTTDKELGNLPVLIFHGPSTTTNSTLNTSRIQAHIYTIAGFQSYPRLTISPSSPLYAAVNHLPSEKQGDEVCRGLAVSLLKYFAELPAVVKSSLVELAGFERSDGAPAMFDEMHAGDLAARMVKVENCAEVIASITTALSETLVSWVDLDVILPPNSTIRDLPQTGSENEIFYDDGNSSLGRFGVYAPLVKLLGSPTFLPTSKIRRAPSRPTPLGKSKSLRKGQKESLRREMCELLDTEERYVAKLHDLVNKVALDFLPKAENKTCATTSPSERAMERLFPSSLTQILDINTSFLAAIRTSLDETEDQAIRDIQASTDVLVPREYTGAESRKPDNIGATEFAKVLIEWLPKFTGPYQDYLRSSSELSRILNDFLRDSASRFSRQIQEIGEQRLRSMLIEPVQRLPRYSLFIDNMVNLLPAAHQAVINLLKARDVIADICSLDHESTGYTTKVTTCLSRLISGWPSSLRARGRLITAVDVAELSPPYGISSTIGQGQASMLLLFANCMVVVRKNQGSTMSARGVLAEVDRPGPSTGATNGNAKPDQPPGLSFSSCFDLRVLRFAESEGGRLIWMTCTEQISSTASRHTCVGHGFPFVKAYLLLGTYQGKAARWSEEISRARIEGRFSEDLRESYKWALHSIHSPAGDLGILAAIFDGDSERTEDATRALGRVRVIVKEATDTRPASPNLRNIDITACITLLGPGRYQLDFTGFNDEGYMDNVTDQNFLAVFAKRLGDLLRLQNQIRNPLLTSAFISCHQKILQALPLRVENEEPRYRSSRPVSPVKMISNFLGGTSTRDMNTLPSQRTALPVMKAIPSIPPPTPIPSRNMSRVNKDKSQNDSKVSLVAICDSPAQKDPLLSLEDTFNTYIVALRSRRGNVVGRVLRGRAGADERLVNELYNVLLEDASRVQAAAEVSVDVLFVAFEKFLNKAWTASMGPILTAQILRDIQSRSDTVKSTDFLEYFRILLADMNPQNRRAFTALVKLLSELLDASGNDGDRGALIATFAEALVLEGNPHEYITLLDRLVDDFDRLFDDSAPTKSAGTTSDSATDSLRRARSINTGSLSSNASSLRKKFGFGTPSRENSKLESDSKVGSVWRTLSKTTKHPSDGESQPPSLSKASLLRSKSTDIDVRGGGPARPSSRDRPNTLVAFGPEETLARPGSGHTNPSTLSSIGEFVPIGTPNLLKKKRRSSLSDLKGVYGFGGTATWSSVDIRKPKVPEKPTGQISMSPRIPSPTRQENGSRTAGYSPQRFGSPSRQVGSPSVPIVSPLTERAINRKCDGVVVTTLSPKRRTESQSGIPMLKGDSRSITSPPTSPTKKPPPSPQKMRMQSPQKLRERLQNEQKVIGQVETSLQAELKKIGDEMSALRIQQHQQPTPAPSSPARSPARPNHIRALSARLTALETKLASHTIDFTTRTTALQKDLDSSLAVSEKKAKKLDELYRDANAENEALYERFNDELGKVLKAVKGGQGVEELKERLREAQEDAGRVRRENARLKREVAGLRGQIKGE